ncbi:MAG: HEAT repeat domain-containing protein [Planctomycetota bacterium]|jgi:HEAT repeat protein
MQKWTKLAGAAILGFGLITGCASGPATDIDQIESRSGGHKTYLDDASLEAFDTDLRALSVAVQRGDEANELALRTKISENARVYQQALLSALHDDDSTARRSVAGVLLGFTGDAAVIPALILKVNNEDEPEHVRLNSMLGLSMMGDKLRDYSEHKALMTVINNQLGASEASFEMRRTAIRTFTVAFDGAQGDSILPLRNRFIGDPDLRVQVASINAMGDIGDVAAVQDLTVVGLKHPDFEIRATSAIALGKINDPTNAVPALIDASQDESAVVRREAIDALSRHYGSDPDTVFTTIQNALADFDPRVRESSAFALARISDPRAISPLIQATGDRTAVVRAAAAAALGDILPHDREKESFPLVDLLADPNPGVQNSSLGSLVRVTKVDHGNDQGRWRTYFYTKYPDLDPAKKYDGKPKPRIYSSNTSGNRARTTRTSNTRNTSKNTRNTSRNTNTRNSSRNSSRNNNNGRRR